MCWDSSSSSIFQSTLSVRRATIFPDNLRFLSNISIHALRKESDSIVLPSYLVLMISIHALRKESDASLTSSSQLIFISIHALRKESDRPSRAARPFQDNFNPRSP